jgi:hypothetical protein
VFIIIYINLVYNAPSNGTGSEFATSPILNGFSEIHSPQGPAALPAEVPPHSGTSDVEGPTRRRGPQICAYSREFLGNFGSGPVRENGCSGDNGGGSGIRTRDTVSRIHTFQACAFNHSAIPPQSAFALPVLLTTRAMAPTLYRVSGGFSQITSARSLAFNLSYAKPVAQYGWPC